MRRANYILPLLIILLFSFELSGKEKKSYINTFVDTLVGKVIMSAQEYGSLTPDYQATIFIRGDVKILKRNILLKVAPHLKKASRDKDNYYAEILGNISYTHPNIFNQTYKTINSNSENFINEHIERIFTPTLKLNVYSPYLYNGIYSPIAPNAQKYYNYSLDSLWNDTGITYYRLKFSPKIPNYKFVYGYFIVNDFNWSVRKLFLNGNVEFVKFTNDIEMCDIRSDEQFLCKSINIAIDASLLGNAIKGSYNSTLEYDKLSVSQVKSANGRGKYDLTMKINTQLDTIPTSPLKLVIKDTLRNVDTVKTVFQSDNSDAFKKVGTFFVKNHSFNINEFSELEISPLFSPILFDFSSKNGTSYAQKLKFTKFDAQERGFLIEPSIGYNFKFKDFYWKVRGAYNYSPALMGNFTFDVGNGDKIHTDRIRNELANLPCTVFDTTTINLNIFKTGYVKLGHKIEVSNGFSIATNLSFNSYTEQNKSVFTVVNQQSEYVDRAKEIAKNTYSSFVPEVELVYTPHQYYYYKGKRKTYLYSQFPTFKLNYAHAIKGIFNSTSKFDKIEFDLQQTLKIGPMHELSYRGGFGIFFNYNDLFFTEFNNLKKNNLPVGWNDDIGGTFQLFPTFKYNEIDKYLRANIKYDAPLLLVPSILRKAKFIKKERLYCNLLVVDSMAPYIEMGYGIGTNIFNLGIFWGGEITKWDTIGAKFTFEIFNN